MAKDRGFGAKVAKGTKLGSLCEKCGEALNTVKVIDSVKKKSSEAWGFKEKMVLVCKCNEKEIYS